MSTRRVAIVGGLRTPFLKAGTQFKDLSAVELGAELVKELVQRTEVDPKEIGCLAFGEVIPARLAPLIAREVGLRSGLPKKVQAFTVVRACATSLQATTDIADQIALGNEEVGIAGGAESLSDIPIFASHHLAQALTELSRAKGLAGKLKALRGLSPSDLVPVPPSLTEPTTGLTMGESAEKMAKENGITRAAQDKLALESHKRAAAAIASGKFASEVMHFPVPPTYETVASEDNIVRRDATLEALEVLKPVFDRQYGTITAGNSSPLTDGAGALMLMSEEKAKALGKKPLGFLRSYAYAGIDPGGQLLMGPVHAAPVALRRAGLTLKDMDLVDMHEAFAAQVLSNLQGFASKAYAQKELGLSEPVGEVDPAKLNVNGGSIALGHPFAATGARMVLSILNELARRNAQYALLTICAAGGLGAAVVLERQ